MPAATLRPVLGKGGCLSAAGPPRLVELLLEAFAATLPSVPVAGGARQFTTQPADLAVLLLDALVPRITLAPGRLRTAQSAALASHTARIGTCAPNLHTTSRIFSLLPGKQRHAGLVVALEKLVDPATRGDPMGPLRWTCSSAALLARELQAAGQQVSERSVNRLLHELGYSLQANRKTLEGRQHPDRDAQFNHINRQVKAFQRQRQPVVSVDTKKKELVGPFKNAGREWRPRGDPERVRVHDFPDSALGKAIPYGVYDLTRDAGWVSVGVDHDTAAFAVETLRRWWWRMGCVSYPAARRLLITADGGGSNGSRNRLWKWELQKLSGRDGASDLGVPFSTGHEQVEQDRAPDVLSHHGKLARSAAGEPGGGGEPDWPHDDA